MYFHPNVGEEHTLLVRVQDIIELLSGLRYFGLGLEISEDFVLGSGSCLGIVSLSIVFRLALSFL